MIAAHALWKQTYGVTSFECLQDLDELRYTRGALMVDLYLHEHFHHLGVVNISFSKVLASLYGDSPGGLD